MLIVHASCLTYHEGVQQRSNPTDPTPPTKACLAPALSECQRVRAEPPEFSPQFAQADFCQVRKETSPHAGEEADEADVLEDVEEDELEEAKPLKGSQFGKSLSAGLVKTEP